LAEVQINRDSENPEYQLAYNLDLLKEAGANNKDTLTLCLTHELSHEFNKNTTFMLCRSERWAHELACDYICGIRSCMMNLATGKYKFLLGRLQTSLSHPPGSIRAEIVDYAREFYHQLQDIEHVNVTFKTAMAGFPAFMYAHAKQLNEALTDAVEMVGKSGNNPQPLETNPKNLNVEDLPDSNLIKQYVLKARSNKIL
jgi:hypothetical protein